MADPWTIFAAIASIVSGGVSYVQAKKAAKAAKKAAKQGQGLLINSEGTNNFIPVIYGERRIAGTRVFVATNDVVGGDPNEYLYLVYVLCEGEVESITDFLIDDLPTSDSRFAYTNSIAINTYLGTDSQTADPMLTAAGIGWTADHTLKGLAYIAVRLKWNSDAFSSIPNITALVKGKKVYDPRTALTAYSTNPALCIRDYLTNNRYGKGLAVSVLDDTAFEEAADFYDTTVEFWASGAVGKLFEFNAVIDTEQTILDNLKDMLLCCRGFLPYTNGVYQLIPDKSGSSSFAFTIDNIIGGIAVRGESKDDKYNKVIITFTDPDNNWQENTAIWPDAGSAEETAYLAEDNGAELVGDFDLPCITNYYAARDLARVYLLRSRNALRCSFDANSDALNLSVGDVVTVTHPTPAWSAKPFQVEEITINYDGTCRVSLLEYDSTIYSYDPASEQLAYADTDLPNPFSIAAPTGLSVTETTYLSDDGTVIPEIKIQWTSPSDAFVDYYEFQYKKTTETDWISVSTPEAYFVEDFAVVGDTYNIRVRSVNTLGVRSTWATSSYTIAGDTTGPATPTGLTIIGSYKEAVLKWDTCTDKDYKETIVYASLTNSFGTAAEEARITGNTVIYYNLPISTTYYVWIRHVDFSGNLGGVSAGVSFTTTAGITTSELADGSVTEPKLGSGAVTETKVASGAVTETKIASSAVTNAKLGTSAVSTVKVESEAISKLASGYDPGPTSITSTFTSLGSLTVNWGASAAVAPSDVIAIIAANVVDLSAVSVDTIEFRISDGTTNYDYYFQGIDPSGIDTVLAAFQVIIPTGGSTSITYELFARSTVSSSGFSVFSRSATFLGLKR